MVAAAPSSTRLQFIRFAAIGTLGFAVSTAVVYGLRALRCDLYTAYAIAFFVAATSTWWLNRRFTFADRGGSIVLQWARFVAANGVGGAINYATYAGLVFAFDIVRLHPVLGTAAGSIAGLAVNFLASRRYVFSGARVGRSAAPGVSGP